MNGYTLNGGTISKRHQLSLCSHKLSLFLACMKLPTDINFFKKIDPYTIAKYDKKYYK
jgi:hypothetical protein